MNRWKSGDRRPARCASGNGCFEPGFEGKGIYCVVEERERHTEKGEPAGNFPRQRFLSVDLTGDNSPLQECWIVV
ncbi:MAG: hypothetical protein LBQ00_08815 [Syntrophobacterales bacterium]|nr:hypothetical protein [Syntrophobacterales bacterium]